MDGHSWKVTAEPTLDRALFVTLGSARRHSGEECCGECEARHDDVQLLERRRACWPKAGEGEASADSASSCLFCGTPYEL